MFSLLSIIPSHFLHFILKFHSQQAKNKGKLIMASEQGNPLNELQTQESVIDQANQKMSRAEELKEEVQIYQTVVDESNENLQLKQCFKQFEDDSKNVVFLLFFFISDGYRTSKQFMFNCWITIKLLNSLLNDG